MNADQRVLTEKQKLVLVLDGMGLTPSQIGAQTGLRTSRVGNIKVRLKELGFEVSAYRKRRAPAEDWARIRQFRREELELVKAPPVMRSKFEPEDDELPDLDEDNRFAGAQRCHCGLIMPCVHEPISCYLNSPGYRDDEDDGKASDWRSWKNGKSRADQGRAAKQPVTVTAR